MATGMSARVVVHAQQLQDLPAVHLRHHDVEQHQVRLVDLRARAAPRGRRRRSSPGSPSRAAPSPGSAGCRPRRPPPGSFFIGLACCALPEVPRCRRTSVISSRTSKGLLMYLRAPHLEAPTHVRVVPTARQDEDGHRRHAARPRASGTSKPDQLRHHEVQDHRDGCRRSIASRACRPSCATTVRKPSTRRVSRTSSAVSRSSSTTSTVGSASGCPASTRRTAGCERRRGRPASP